MLKKANNMPSRLCIAAISEENNQHTQFLILQAWVAEDQWNS